MQGRALNPKRYGLHRRTTALCFAIPSPSDLRLVPGRPGGGWAMPDGTLPTLEGWNRISIEVTRLETVVTRLRKAGVHFPHNNIVTGVSGKQIFVEDPSESLVGFFESAMAEPRMGRVGAEGDSKRAAFGEHGIEGHHGW